MNIPGNYDMMTGILRPEDPAMTAFLATPEVRKLFEDAAAIDQAQRGGTAATPPAAPTAPVPPTAPNPFAQLLGGEGSTLQALLGASALPPRQTGGKVDPWDLLLHLGPALMQAGSRPGASFLGSVGEGLGVGLKAAQAARRDAMTAEQQDRLYNLQRAKLGVDLAQSMKKADKAPTVAEFFDEKTGQPYKAQYDPKTEEWRRIGGVKADGKSPTLQEIYDEKTGRKSKGYFDENRKWVPVGGIEATSVKEPPLTEVGPDGKLRLRPGAAEMLTEKERAMLAGRGGKPPMLREIPDETGFSRLAVIDPDTLQVRGYIGGHKLQTLPAGGSLIGPELGGQAGPGAGSPYARNTAGFENPTGNPAARNPNSTATGNGQFLEGTWRELWPQIAQDAAPVLMKKGIDPARLTPQQILALRADPDVSAVAIDTYAAVNRPVLRQALGRDPDAGELQTAHMFGGAGAVQILKASPQTPIQQIVSPEVYAANERFLAGKTAGDVVNYFRQRQGRGQGVANAPSQAPVQVASADGPVLSPGVREIARGPRVAGNMETEEQKVVGKQLGDSYIEYQKGAKSARLTRERIAQAERLAEGLETGGWTGNLLDLQRNLGSIGIKMNFAGKAPEVARMEALRALANEYALTLRDPSQGSGMPGQMSNFDVQFLSQAANMGLDTTPEGRRLSFEFRKKMAERNIDLAKMAEKWRRDRGSLDGFEPYAADWAEKNSLFSERDVERAQRVSAKAVPPPSAPAQNLRVTTPTRSDTRGPFDPATKTETVPVNEQGGIPRTANGAVDKAKLKQGEVYAVDGKRWRWTGTNFIEVTEPK
jgi:hypothetical protein